MCDHYQALEAIKSECQEYITPEVCDRLIRLARDISYKTKNARLEKLVNQYSDIFEMEFLHSSQIDHLIEMCTYYLDGKYAENYIEDDPPTKRVRFNPKGKNMYLNDGKVLSEEKSILDCQRIWSHNAYKPGGYMYKRVFQDFNYMKAKEQFKRMNV
jgi:hypothetical protein